jgi:hypothetical protein
MVGDSLVHLIPKDKYLVVSSSGVAHVEVAAGTATGSAAASGATGSALNEQGRIGTGWASVGSFIYLRLQAG